METLETLQEYVPAFTVVVARTSSPLFSMEPQKGKTQAIRI